MDCLGQRVGPRALIHREVAFHRPTRHPSRPCVRIHARKGFGATLPKLPSFGKSSSKDKAPAGGVLPTDAVDLGIPNDVERLWSTAQAQWRQYSIDHPVLLPAQGAQVHLVPVGADLPGDAALIRDVVAAVQPDAIALESPPQHLKTYTAFAKAVESQLTQLLSSPSSSAATSDLLAAGPTAARTRLSRAQREQLQTALLGAARSGTVKPEPDQFTYLFRLGSLPFAEWLAPAHLVRTWAPVQLSSSQPPPQQKAGPRAGPGAGVGLQFGSLSAQGIRSSLGLGTPQQPQSGGQAPMLLVSCGLDKEARAAAGAASSPYLGREFDVYVEEVEAALGGLWDEIAAWRTVLGDRLEAAGAGREAAWLLATWEAQCCLGPEQQRQVVERVVQRMVEEAAASRGTRAGEGSGSGEAALEIVRTPADPWVAKRLVELVAGKNVVRPCRRIVAVVGRLHLLSVEEELRKLTEVQAR